MLSLFLFMAQLMLSLFFMAQLMLSFFLYGSADAELFCLSGCPAGPGLWSARFATQHATTHHDLRGAASISRGLIFDGW